MIKDALAVALLCGMAYMLFVFACAFDDSCAALYMEPLL